MKKYTITILTKSSNGTYAQSGDVLPDMLNGDTCPGNMVDILSWLSELGYKPADGFAGWGMVVQHVETGEILSVSKCVG